MSPLSIILVLLISLVYGVIFLILSLLNYKLFEKFSIIFQFLITLLFSFDFGMIYLLIIYKINYGCFHIYYLIPLHKIEELRVSSHFFSLHALVNQNLKLDNHILLKF